MRRIHWITLNLFTASAILLAQDSPARSPQSGGWRRAGDPAAPVATAPAGTPNTPDQDPSQPVARTDAYGQPVSPQSAQPQEAQSPAAQPPVAQAPAPQWSSSQPQAAPPQGSSSQPQLPVDQQTLPPVQRNDRYQNDRPQAAVPHYGLPVSVTIKPGTYVSARINQGLSSDHKQAGDIFTATLTQPLVVDGVVVAQRGQTLMGRVSQAEKAGRAKGVSHLGLQLTGLNVDDGTQVPIQSHVVSRIGDTSVGRDAAAARHDSGGGRWDWRGGGRRCRRWNRRGRGRGGGPRGRAANARQSDRGLSRERVDVPIGIGGYGGSIARAAGVSFCRPGRL